MNDEQKPSDDPVIPNPIKHISLRDYFAASALAMGDAVDDPNWDKVAENCYNLADAMLKARGVQ